MLVAYALTVVSTGITVGVEFNIAIQWTWLRTIRVIHTHASAALCFAR